MLDTCLPATGPDFLALMLLAVLAAALIAAGWMLRRSSRARVALVLTPLLLLGGAGGLAVTAAPAAHAAQAQIPGFEVAGQWRPLGDWVFGHLYTPEQEAALAQLAALGDGATVTTTVELAGPHGESATLALEHLAFIEGLPTLDFDEVKTITALWQPPPHAKVTRTVTYPDGCGATLTTVLRWSGSLDPGNR